MANRALYNKFVIGKMGEKYVEGMVEYGGAKIFEKKDSPKKWGMTSFGADNKTSYWNIGFVSDEFNELYSFPSMEGKNFAWCTKPSPYWFCRTRKWMPYWGKATAQRAELVQAIRAHWVNKWYSEIVPEIKKALIETTNLPKDVIEFVMPEYFEYPYEIKSF